ncbi:MAG: RcpC/CpaB family pilus assembly protein [Anaerolineae bacterium]
MMGRRVLLFFVAGIFIVLIIIVVVLVTQSNQSTDTPVADEAGDNAQVVDEAAGAEQPALEPAEPLQPMVDVVVSLQTLPRGWQFTEANIAGPDGLVLEKRLESEVEGNEFTLIEDVLGLYLRSDIFQGETLTKDMLVADPGLVGVEDYGPSSLIPPGTVAAAIPIDRLSSVAYAIAEGDFVDIMVTFRFYKIDKEFQTYLQNAGVFFVDQAADVSTGGDTGTTSGGETFITQEIFMISPYGRFETLPTGDLAHISPSEFQRPFPITMILQNARAIQVGEWEPPNTVQLPTATPPPLEEGQATPTFSPIEVTPTPSAPDVILLALSPQQQLFLKYALESGADIDLALRAAREDQIYSIQNVDLNFLLEHFNIQVPDNFDFSVDIPASDPSAPTPTATQKSQGGG